MALGVWSGLNSTYICPLVVGDARTVPLMQWFAASLDSFLAIAVYELALPQSNSGSTGRSRGPAIWSTMLIVSHFTVNHLYLNNLINLTEGNGCHLVSSRL